MAICKVVLAAMMAMNLERCKTSGTGFPGHPPGCCDSNDRLTATGFPLDSPALAGAGHFLVHPRMAGGDTAGPQELYPSFFYSSIRAFLHEVDRH